MKFQILSVKGNSVRVKTGICTFDVIVNDGNVELPRNVYIADYNTRINLIGAVLGEYNRSLQESRSYEISRN